MKTLELQNLITACSTHHWEEYSTFLTIIMIDIDNIVVIQQLLLDNTMSWLYDHNYTNDADMEPSI